jgi:uncharacterized protein YbjT (DUF2867 family)
MSAVTIKRILVVAATGRQGGGVVRECLADSHQVYALVRDTSSIAAQKLKSVGAELVTGDLDNFQSLKTAVEQTRPDVIFLNLPVLRGAQVAQSRNMISAARTSASVKHLIYSSVLYTGQHETFPGWGPEHPMYEFWVRKHEIEDQVRNAGFQRWTILRMGLFIQNLTPPSASAAFPELWPSESGAEGGIFRTAFKSEKRIGWIDARDIGVVVVAVVRLPDEYAGKELGLVTEALTASEVAERMGKGIGREVKSVYEEPETLAKKLGPYGGRVVASHVLFNELNSCVDIQELNRKFKLTSVREFFSKYRG